MKKFLLDTSCFIDSKNQFYPFDFAPSFWKQLSQFIQDGSILIHEAVYAELVKGDDELKDWANKNISSYKISGSDLKSMLALRQVLDHVAECGYYNDAALHKWSNEAADPQLIASALVNGAVIVTFEKSKGSRDTARKGSNPKIPDVAKDLGVETINLYAMMRILKFRL